jgi:cobalt/nickel transport system permease protein
MHIPDGLMAPLILAIGWVAALIAIGIAARKGSMRVTNDKVPTMAVLSAGIFVAQMLNFPIIGGTTGHLLGATLAVMIVGPLAAIIVMSVVIIIQGLLFGDGGIIAMGLNLTNMAVVAVLVGATFLRLTEKLKTEVSVFVASWSSVFVASLVCAVELAISNLIAPGSYGIVWTVSIPTMVGLHSVIAIGEALITVSVAAYFLKAHPHIISSSKRVPEASA